MKILFVVGGSYKAFYLNNINKYKRLDLIVFQEGLLYEFDYYDEMFGAKTITSEMMSLCKKFGCKIIAKIRTNLLNKKYEEFLYCDKNGVKIIKSSRYFKIFIKNKQILISNYFLPIKSDYFLYFAGNKNEFVLPKSQKSVVFVCDKTGVDLHYDKFMMRKFRKICYFSLNF